MVKYRFGGAIVMLLLALMLLSAFDFPVAQAAENRASVLWYQGSAIEFSGWKLDGLRLDGEALTLDSAHAKVGNDPYTPGSYSGGNYFNGGSYYYGEGLAPYYGSPGGFNNAIASWNADTPPGSWVMVSLRALVNGHWTKFYTMGVWAADTATVRRHSVDGQNDADGRVDTDTLSLNSSAAAFQLKVTMYSANPNQALPRLWHVSVNTVRNGATPPFSSDRKAWGKDLPVPERSQMIYPDGGEVWCSPTSLSMVMAFLDGKYGLSGLTRPVPQTAEATYDWIYKGNGNWLFNVAHATTGLNGALNGAVMRYQSLVQVERWIEQGLPVIASVAYSPGQLTGSPISATDGHLLVIRGFDGSGNPIVNDPASDPRKGQSVRIVYPRAAFERVWQNGSGGAVYLLYPRNGWTDPRNWISPDYVGNQYAYPEIGKLWGDADAATLNGKSRRGWVWGTGPSVPALLESYDEGVDGQRVVQYFDKSRMEVTSPQGDRNSLWFVTNGLLTKELVSGKMQVGNGRFENRTPANIPVAGDPDSPLAPTYATFENLATLPGFEQARRATNRTGQFVSDTLDRQGNITQGSSGGLKYANYDPQLGHNIPDALWSWMNNPARSGIDNWVFVLGYPISEPYWVQVNIGGKPARVLVQLYERRTLTYNPANPVEWQVEMGNIGQHYYRWRYGG